MYSIFFLLLFPALIAVLLLLVKNDKIRGAIVIPGAIAIMAVSVYVAVEFLKGGTTYFDFESEMLNWLMLAIEIILCAIVVYLGIKHKKYLASILSLAQAVFLVWFEFTHAHEIDVSNNLYIDQFSIIMILIIGVIGSVICIYSLGYMRDFQEHHAGEKDRRPWFFFLMFIFLSAMFGIVTSNNLMWMFFFWEVTTLCSFALIGFTKTEEAVNNSFRQIIMNLVGGIAFILAIIVLGTQYGVMEFDALLELDSGAMYVMLAVGLLSIAGIAKAALMPFHSWLLGAMVAPTPTSALLHSSTMVKAGVFLILRLSPMYGDNTVGYMVMCIGGLTFLLASMAAISQSNAKRVLAYSTIANLGLIAACGAVGTYEALWAGIMILIFHAVTKSMLFLCVGTAEHHIGSRDIEDMDGLFSRMPKLSALMIIGIAGMFLAPFGMLISKWAAMISFVNSENLVLIACICFGSAVTIFYWGKWLGKMVAVVANSKDVEETVHKEEWSVLGLLAVLVVAVCFSFPLISSEVLSPYLLSVFGQPVDPIFATFGIAYVSVLLGMLALLVVVPIPFFNKTKKKVKENYMCGVNNGDNLSYSGSMGTSVNVSMRNWYMEEWFGENRINKIGLVITIAIIVVAFALIIGGVTS
ncbi:MAG: hypothetical protein KRP56_06580 [Candidatus Methanogranum gryphiswaldense]|nr:MAG: hypothetical protein KRP56_06580 [Candidatus Methanogranum sp. U3.2.1]